MIKLLHTLTPAESLLIRKCDIASKQEILKVTLVDLLLKQVLKIHTEQKQSDSRDPVRTLRYVERGEKFEGYAALPHELLYLSDFRKSGDLRMLFRNCVQVAFDNSLSERELRHVIRSSPALQGLFKQSFLEKLLGGFDYTAQGLQKLQELEREIKTLELSIPKLMESNRAEALAEMRKLGGNVFLLHGLTFAMLEEIENEFKRNIPTKETAQGCGGGGGCGTFTSYSNDFDSSCPSDSSDSGGCSSGDGGCSSGCGGCGGD